MVTYEGPNDEGYSFIPEWVDQSNSVEKFKLSLNFLAPFVSPIGQSKMWYKWSFYDDNAPLTVRKYHTTVFGSNEPHEYTTMYTWDDMFDTEIVNLYFYWQTGLSIFWIFTTPI